MFKQPLNYITFKKRIFLTNVSNQINVLPLEKPHYRAIKLVIGRENWEPVEPVYIIPQVYQLQRVKRILVLGIVVSGVYWNEKLKPLPKAEHSELFGQVENFKQPSEVIPWMREKKMFLVYTFVCTKTF